MTIFLNSAAILLAVLGTGFIIGNYVWSIIGLRNRRRGVERRVSLVFVVPQVCLFFSDLISRTADDRLLPPWLLLALGLSDPSVWYLATRPIFVLFRRSEGK